MSSGISSRPIILNIQEKSNSFNKYITFLSKIEIQSKLISLKKPFNPPNNKTICVIMLTGLL